MTGQRMAARLAAGAAVAVLTVTGSAVAVADDDIESLPAQQIADRTRDALLSVDSLRLTSTGDLGEGRPPMTVDLTLDRDGNCRGSVDLGDDKGAVEVVKRGNAVWLKPDSDFWKNQVPIGGTTFEAILDGRYMKGEADDPRLLSVTQACDLDTFRELLTDNADTSHGTLTKGTKTTVRGTDVIPLTRTEGKEKVTLYVATEGKPYPVRLTVQGPSADAVVGFSGFDKPVPTATPSEDETVDVTALLGRTPAPV
ncbi:hypothetical protein OG230_29245 [Streptomyces sp. NBC_00234]|uniref:hypothetical protein n=1 Tax=Streptomyces sp. NBC_00234 TaxID=2903638 RepID=UPI002E2CECFE|nr:hypothetical protein [Streptomyces sp. NBC_00234]